MSKRILYLGTDPPIAQSDEVITHVPLIRIVPRPFTDREIQECLRDFNEFSHLIITSKNTIPILQDYLQLFDYEKGQWLKKSIIAVGKATEKALRSAGWDRILVANEERAEGVVQILDGLVCVANYFFWAHSGQARSLIRDFLQERRMRHKSCALYDPAVQIPLQVPDTDEFDEIVLTSPSVVDACVMIFGGLPSMEKCKAIGPVTEEYFRRQCLQNEKSK